MKNLPLLRWLAILAIFLFSSCSGAAPAPAPANVSAHSPAISGERLAYVIGCVNCHHQTPKEIINAPSLIVAQTYTLPEFRTLMTTGVTRDGRDLYAKGSIMGIVAREQLSHMTASEMASLHQFLQARWTAERAAYEEAKIAGFPSPTFVHE